MPRSHREHHTVASPSRLMITRLFRGHGGVGDPSTRRFKCYFSRTSITPGMACVLGGLGVGKAESRLMVTGPPGGRSTPSPTNESRRRSSSRRRIPSSSRQWVSYTCSRETPRRRSSSSGTRSSTIPGTPRPSSRRGEQPSPPPPLALRPLECPPSLRGVPPAETPPRGACGSMGVGKS